MMFMALDHALYFWSFGRVSNEGLPLVTNGTLSFLGAGNPSLPASIAMIMASMAAPGFLLIAGYVLALSVKRREETGASSWEISKHLWLRGLALIVLQVLVASPAFNLPAFVNGDLEFSVGVILSLSVLSTIGLGFIFLDLGRHISAWKLMAFTAFLYLLSESLLPHFARAYSGLSWLEQGLRTLLVLPVPFSSQLLLNNNFPVIPWLLPLCLGWLYGRTYKPEKGLAYEGKRWGLSGLISLGLFFILRMAGLGDYLRASSPDQFFVLSKYPPSPDYFLFYLGLVFLLFYLFNRLPKPGRVVAVLDEFGKTPLFFYAVHLWLYALVPALFNHFNRTPLWAGAGIWLMGLVILYPLCRWSVKLRSSLKAILKPNPGIN
nr:heparan-alpha-glucosaminide N-acetyltransferase domain-containing protein [Acididesulfobacillus acetoxydans]